MPPVPPISICPRPQTQIQTQPGYDQPTLSADRVPGVAICRGSAAVRYWVYVACLLAALAVVMLAGCTGSKRALADEVVVWKSKRKMALLRRGKVLHEYRIALGDRPWGHKRQEGDERTPEGDYVLDWRNPDSRYYRSIHISYPNERDLRFARAMGRDPGGMTMIHGQPVRVPSPMFRERYLSGLLAAIGRSSRAKAGTGGKLNPNELPVFLATGNLKPFMSKELTSSTTPIFSA